LKIIVAFQTEDKHKRSGACKLQLKPHICGQNYGNVRWRYPRYIFDFSWNECHDKTTAFL